MYVEITGVEMHQGIVTIYATDISDENLQRMERYRDDEIREIEFIFDTRDKRAFDTLYRWLKNQKSARGAGTYGEALRRTVGTITTISAKFRVWY